MIIRRVKMTKKEYLQFHKEFTEEMIRVSVLKNSDYTGTTDDPFANLKACEVSSICSTEQGVMVRMTDKMARINSFIQKGELLVKDESVADTLLDLSNYCALLAAYIKAKRVDSSSQPLYINNCH